MTVRSQKQNIYSAARKPRGILALDLPRVVEEERRSVVAHRSSPVQTWIRYAHVVYFPANAVVTLRGSSPVGDQTQTGMTVAVVGSWKRGKMKSPTMVALMSSKPVDSPMQNTGCRWLAADWMVVE